MAPVLDGLLDADLDLRILSLSLHEKRTHATLTQLSLVRPFTSSLSCPSSSPPSFLWVPPLRIPWASSLAKLMLNHLNVRLIPISSEPTFVTDVPSLLSVLSAANFQTKDWNKAVDSFYMTLPESAEKHNQVVLSSVANVERLATCARLAFINSLVSSLGDISTEWSLFVNNNHGPDKDDVLIEEHEEQKIEDECNVCCTGSALWKYKRSSCIIVTAHLLPCSSSHSSSSSSKEIIGGIAGALVHGVVIHADVLSAVCEVVRARYRVEITFQNHRKPCTFTNNNNSIGTLSSLSNKGSALLTCPASTLLCQCKYKTQKQTNTRQIDDYLRESFGTTWQSVITEATIIARRTVISRACRRAKEAHSIHEDAITLRDNLIQRAVELDVAGAPLARIAAVAVVRAGLTDCVEERILDVYGNVLEEARVLVEVLKQRDSSASHLLSRNM